MSATGKLSDLGEFGFIDRIAARATTGSGVITGIGDDAAVTGLSPGMQLLTSTDMLLEDVHFRRSWHDPFRLGRKSLAVNISDIAAMGAIPRWATLSLAVPPGLPLDFLDQFTAGFISMASEHSVSLIGGDTCSSRSGLVISVTIMGEQFPDRIIRRSGACSGDDIWVTGSLGDAALGLMLLESNAPADERLLARLLDPVPRAAFGAALAEVRCVSAMIDISDGIVGDLGHICELSGCGAELFLDRLPVSPEFRSAVGTSQEFPWQLVLSGGEDYELCFTASPGHRENIAACAKKCGINAVTVGIVTGTPGVRIQDTSGAIILPEISSFNHFT